MTGRWLVAQAAYHSGMCAFVLAIVQPFLLVYAIGIMNSYNGETMERHDQTAYAVISLEILFSPLLIVPMGIISVLGWREERPFRYFGLAGLIIGVLYGAILFHRPSFFIDFAKALFKML